MSDCPVCKQPSGEPHAAGCAMECPLCRPPCGTGHRDGCAPPVIVSPENALLKWLRRESRGTGAG